MVHFRSTAIPQQLQRELESKITILKGILPAINCVFVAADRTLSL